VAVVPQPVVVVELEGEERRAGRGLAGEAEVEERVGAQLVDGSQASRMFDLAGVTPPASVVSSQAPGSVSLLPPVNAVSASFGSAPWRTWSAASRACQSIRASASS
jgi:hypothetical protein